MTASGWSHDRIVRPEGRAAPVLSTLYLAVLVLSVSRTLVGSGVLDLVMSYRADQGSIVEKLHPAFYGFAAVALFALTAFRIALAPYETGVVRAMLLFLASIVALIAYTVATGIGTPVGFLVDNYVGACFSALLFLFPPSQRRLVGRALMVVLVLSAVTALVEFLFKVAILPHPAAEATFRPVGLSSHPLELGLWCAVAIPFATAAGWSRRLTALACAILAAGLAASGARTAMVAGGACMLVVAFAAVAPQRWSRRRLERRLILVIAAAVAVPLMLGILYAIGALDRFQDGIADDSAAARVLVYRVFDYMSWSDMLFGIGIQRLDAIALDELHLFAVESTIVVFVALFGIIGALLFAGTFLWLLTALLRGARPAAVLGTVLFTGVALSNNALSSKEPSVFTLMVLIIAFRPSERDASLTFG